MKVLVAHLYFMYYNLSIGGGNMHKLFSKTKKLIDNKIKSFLSRHQVVGFLIFMFGMPIVMVLCITIYTILLTFPIAMLFC